MKKFIKVGVVVLGMSLVTSLSAKELTSQEIINGASWTTMQIEKRLAQVEAYKQRLAILKNK